jgi:hypothetical protein
MHKLHERTKQQTLPHLDIFDRGAHAACRLITASPCNDYCGIEVGHRHNGQYSKMSQLHSPAVVSRDPGKSRFCLVLRVLPASVIPIQSPAPFHHLGYDLQAKRQRRMRGGKRECQITKRSSCMPNPMEFQSKAGIGSVRA